MQEAASVRRMSTRRASRQSRRVVPFEPLIGARVVTVFGAAGPHRHLAARAPYRLRPGASQGPQHSGATGSESSSERCQMRTASRPPSAGRRRGQRAGPQHRPNRPFATANRRLRAARDQRHIDARDQFVTEVAAVAERAEPAPGSVDHGHSLLRRPTITRRPTIHPLHPLASPCRTQRCAAWRCPHLPRRGQRRSPDPAIRAEVPKGDVSAWAIVQWICAPVPYWALAWVTTSSAMSRSLMFEVEEARTRNWNARSLGIWNRAMVRPMA